MSNAIALDIAILLPPDISRVAIALNASLPQDESQGLTLDADHLPHITLAQLFVAAETLNDTFDRLDSTLRGRRPYRVRITGSHKVRHTLWLAVEPDHAIVELHERVMQALSAAEVSRGGPEAFVDGNARDADVRWVAEYRLKSSFAGFRPHITLGHGSRPPCVAPFEFDADTVATCHLGRFCTCRRVLRSWRLAR